MSERLTFPEIKVSPESLPEWRLAVGTLREKPGIENVTLDLIRSLRGAAQELGEHEHVFHFWLEESLVWQHIAMKERDKAGESDEQGRDLALNKMEEAALRAEEYRVAHKLEELKGDSLRFMGRVASYRGEHEKALQFYRQSKELLLRMLPYDPKRIRWIEVQGFEAEALIMTGSSQEGLELAKTTWRLYEEDTEIRSLKVRDPYTHKVWQSGVAIVAVRALLETDNISLLHGAEIWLEKAEERLMIPEDMETWGDRNFAIRRREIRKLRERLRY